MTEAEWLESVYPLEMLSFITRQATARKLRLFVLSPHLGCPC
jgi:hypothetical protein